MNKSFIKKTGLLLTGLLVLGGCNLFGPTQEQQVMRSMQSKLWGREMKSGNISGTLTFDITQGSDKVKISASADTDFDVATKDDEKVRVALDLSGNGTMPTGDAFSGTLDIEISYLAKMLYLKLNELAISPTPPEIEPVLAMIEPFIGSWYVMDMGLLTGAGVTETKSESNMTKEQEAKVKDLLGQSDIFKVTKVHANETLSTVDCYHYTIAVDNSNMVKFVKEVSAIMEEKFTADDEKQMLDGLNKMVLGGDLWIGLKDSYIYKGDISIAIDNKEQASKGTIGAMFTINPNKPITVTAPSGALDLMTEIQKLMPPAPTIDMNSDYTIPSEEFDMDGSFEIPVLPGDGEGVIDEGFGE